jgi:hypothetical protein
MANPTAVTILPPAVDLPTTTRKSLKKRDDVAAAVAHGVTAASIHPKSRYSSRNAGNKTSSVLGASPPLVEIEVDARAEDAAVPPPPANLAAVAAKKSL